MSLPDLVPLAATLMESAGVAVIIGGSAFAAVQWLRRIFTKTERGDLYTFFRQQLGRAILLGLEFLVAADIIRTVAEHPTIQKVLVLAVIVLVRTFLSFTLEVELEGRWPWQRNR